MTRSTRPLLAGRALALALCATVAPLTFAAAAPAELVTPEAPAARVRPVVGVLVTGTLGENEVSVVNPDGSTATGSLGGRYEAFAGAEFPIDPNGLALRLTAGIHASGNFPGGGGNERLTRFPFEATLWYPLNDQLRIGGGARYALHSRFSGAGGKTSDGLGATPALVLGVGWRVLPHLLVEGRYVYERYEQASGVDLDASHWGLGLTAAY